MEPGRLESPAWEGEFFAIPVERVDARHAVWFERGALPLDDVVPFEPSAYRELKGPPAAYADYLRRYATEGRRPRPFAHVPHLLVAAPIDVGGVELVRAHQPCGAR